MRAAAVGLITVGLGVLVAACGGSSGATTPTATASAANGLTAYTDCLRQNGVNLPSFTRGPRPSGSPRPSFSPGGFRNGGGGGGFGGGGFGTQAPAGVDQATWTKAMQACSSLRPTGRGGNGGNNSAFTAYRNCLADHGVAMNAGPPNTADPKYAAAVKACAALRPTGRPTPSPSAP
jgi:hypothetical protein